MRKLFRKLKEYLKSRKLRRKYKFLYSHNYDNYGTAPIQILKGTYKDTIYRYMQVSLPEEKDTSDGKLHLRFTYEVLESPVLIREDEVMFIDTIGEILVHIIEQGDGEWKPDEYVQEKPKSKTKEK